MANIFTHVPYADTGYFSHLVTDYLKDDPNVQQFYHYRPDSEGLAQAIAARAQYPVNRQVLTDVLKKQYAKLPKYGKTEENIELLQQENTFTICTAHQPNLLTGYLYFVYKILHAIKLAEELSAQYPDKNFVPVYYMGSEDNDLEELGTFRFRGDKYVWDGAGQAGAVGRMNTASLKPLLNDLFKVFGPPGKNCDNLQNIVTTAYLKHKTVGAATQYLVNELFGRFGLVVLDPDEADLKRLFIPVMRDELLQQSSLPVITQQVEKLGANYRIQAHPREINLFYLLDGLRERIEKAGDKWLVVNTDIQFSQEELLKDLNENPGRFSPNVMLRGLFQETILPNVAFIGGGAEVAYWLQLKTLFEHYRVAYPVVLLRQSVLWSNEAHTKLRQEMELSVPELFKEDDQLSRDYVSRHTSGEWKTEQETAEIEQIFARLQQKVTSLDPTLTQAAGAALTKMKYQLKVMETKMLRAEKRKMDVQLARIARLKAGLFPKGSLQERVENFAEYYLEYGPTFFDVVKQGIEPLRAQFLVIE